MSESSDAIRPFSCGTAYLDWLEENCEGCQKGVEYDGNPQPFICDIQAAISRGALSGVVSLPIAARMGAIEHKGHYTWRCREFQAKEEARE